MSANQKFDVHQEITDRIVASIETAGEFRLPWIRNKGGSFARPVNIASGRFGTEAYAVEELIAELGAAFLCSDLSVTPEPRADHAQYIANWLRVLKDDKRAIFTAASKASQAANWLMAAGQNAAS